MRTMTEWVDLAEAEGVPQRDGATDADLTHISGAFSRLFGIPMPTDYVDLLTITNGFDFDGVLIFGTHDQDDADGFLPGVLDSNERLIHGVESVDTPLRFVGEAGDLLLARDTTASTWVAVSRLGWTTRPELTFRSFSDLFNATMSTTV